MTTDVTAHSPIEEVGGVPVLEWFRRFQTAALDTGGEGMAPWLRDALAGASRQVADVPGLEGFQRQVDLSAHRGEVPFEIFVVGEGKAGKSTFINALFGRAVAPVDFLPKTYCFHRFIGEPEGPERSALITEDLEEPGWSHLRRALASCPQGREQRFWRYDCTPALAASLLEGEEQRIQPGGAYRTPLLEVEWRLKAPQAAVSGMRLVDTQGLDQILASTTQKKHLEWEYGRADAVIWVVSAVKVRSGIVDRYLDLFGRFNKPAILVLNQIDRIPAAARQRVLEEAQAAYGGRGLPVIPFCASQACSARDAGDVVACEQSGYAALAALLRERFQNKQRLVRSRSLYAGARQRQRDYRQAMKTIRDAATDCARLYRQAVTQTDLVRIAAQKRAATETAQQCRLTHEEVRPRFATVGYEDDQQTVQDRLRVLAVAAAISDFEERLRRTLNQDFEEHLAQLSRQTYRWPEVEATGEAREFALLPRVGDIDWAIRVTPLRVELDVSVAFFSRLAVGIASAFGFWGPAREFAQRRREELAAEKRTRVAEDMTRKLDAHFGRLSAAYQERAAAAASQIHAGLQEQVERLGGEERLAQLEEEIEHRLGEYALPSVFYGLPRRAMGRLGWPRARAYSGRIR